MKEYLELMSEYRRVKWLADRKILDPGLRITEPRQLWTKGDQPITLMGNEMDLSTPMRQRVFLGFVAPYPAIKFTAPQAAVDAGSLEVRKHAMTQRVSLVAAGLPTSMWQPKGSELRTAFVLLFTKLPDEVIGRFLAKKTDPMDRTKVIYADPQIQSLSLQMGFTKFSSAIATTRKAFNQAFQDVFSSRLYARDKTFDIVKARYGARMEAIDARAKELREHLTALNVEKEELLAARDRELKSLDPGYVTRSHNAGDLAAMFGQDIDASAQAQAGYASGEPAAPRTTTTGAEAGADDFF
jgi:hypothetical protein